VGLIVNLSFPAPPNADTAHFKQRYDYLNGVILYLPWENVVFDAGWRFLIALA